MVSRKPETFEKRIEDLMKIEWEAIGIGQDFDLKIVVDNSCCLFIC